VIRYHVFLLNAVIFFYQISVILHVEQWRQLTYWFKIVSFETIVVKGPRLGKYDLESFEVLPY